MDRHFRGACPLSTFESQECSEMDFDMEPPNTYFDAQPQQHIPQDGEQNSDEYPVYLSSQWPAMSFQYHNHRMHQRHQSASTQSSHSSAFRSSNGSSFSQWHPRDSVASTNTTWSHFSESSRDQFITQTDLRPERSLNFDSPATFSPQLIEELTAPQPTKRVSQRQLAQEKEPFATCVSRTKRPRRSQKEPRYWCTSCGEGFGEKYDWKRHEETYQERSEMYECSLCENVYFLDKDFVHHHQKSHRCQTCVKNQHALSARRSRKMRTGWGCGFCCHFDSNWTERCNHLGWHFEKNRDTMTNWHHSQLILSLLQRPEILPEWNHVLDSKQRVNPRFYWRERDTGRVEGYPEANPNPQLQDLLEFYTPEQNAAAIARLAFEKGLVKKQLPLPPLPPIVPPKDHRTQHHVAHSDLAQDLLHDTEYVAKFLGTIIEDENPPTGVCPLDYHALDEAFLHETHPFL